MPGKRSAKQATPARPRQGSTTNGAERHGTTDAGEMLAGRHQAIREAAGKLEGFKSTAAGVKQLHALCELWAHHCAMETDIVYPEFREAGVDEAAIGEVQIAHDLVTILMADLMVLPKENPRLVPGVRVLARLIFEVIEDKADTSSGLIAAAKEAGVDMPALGEKIQERLSIDETAEEHSIDLVPRELRGVAFSRRPKEEERMRGHQQDRDEYGRFLPEREEDRRYARSRDDDERSYRSRGRDDDRRRYEREDDDRRNWRHHDLDDRGYASRGLNRQDDDERRHPQRASGYEGDRDRDYGYDSERSRHGGWFGDPQRHAEASRRGWDERRSRDDDEDDDRRTVRRRRYD